MGSEDQLYGGVGLGRLPPSMQSLRERIGGLKAATSAAALSFTADSTVKQRYSSSVENAQDGVLAVEQFGRVNGASQNGTPYLQRKKTSWETELEAYLSASSDAAAVSNLRDNLQTPEAWLRFLQNEESTRKSQGHAGPSPLVGIGRLYEWATKAIPRSQNISNEDYLRIWVGYAKQQMESSEEDARQVFKYLKSHHVGHSLASLYEEWALFEIAAGQPQKALQKVQEGIRQQATPVGRLEALQGKLLASLPTSKPQTHAASYEQPSPISSSYALDRFFQHQSTPSADQARQPQSTPSTYRQQPFQPSLQSIPSPVASLEPLSTPSRAVSQSTPLTASVRVASVSKKPEGLRQEDRSANQQVLETTVVGAAEACKGGYSTPYGKATGSVSGPMTADNTTVLGMPTPSFGLGTGTFGKGVLSGGFKFDDTAHSVAGSSSYTSQDTGRETGYGHTSHSLGGRSSIGSSFRWQPSPSSLTTRQVTTSVSSGGGQDRSRSALEGPGGQESSGLERKSAGSKGVAPEKTVDGLSDRSAAQMESEGAVKGTSGWGQEGMGKSALLKEWPPVLRTDTAETNFEVGSSGGSVSPTETVQLPAKDLPLADVSGLTVGRKDGASEAKGGAPLPGARVVTEAPSGTKQEPAANCNPVVGTTEVATSATAAAGGLLSRERSLIPSNQHNKTPNPAFVRSVQSIGGALERPQWMREPSRKLAPTLSPVEERSRERASSTATSAKSGSKSSGSSSVKSAVTSRGDEETVSLSKVVEVPADPMPEKQKALPSESAAVSKAGAAGRLGNQLRRLGLSGRAQRVAGTDDASSSAESTEEVAPTTVLPKQALPQVKLPIRELPSDEELLRKLEGGPKPALSQAQEERARGAGNSKPGAEAAEIATPDEGARLRVLNGSQLGADVSDSREEKVVEQVGASGKPAQPESAAVAARAQAGAPPPRHERAFENPEARPNQRPSGAHGDVRSAPSSSSREPARAASPIPALLESSRAAKSLVSSSLNASSKKGPQSATPQPSNQVQVAQAPVSNREPSPRPRQPPQVPTSEQQRNQDPAQRGPSQATPTQGSHRAEASGSARSSTRQKEAGQVWYVNGKRYQTLRSAGKGGSSRVYKVIGPGYAEFALKRVELKGDVTEMQQGFLAEIDLLKRLQKGRNIIRYIDSEVCRDAMYVVLEYGEIDLAALLKREEVKAKEMGRTEGDGSTCVDENFIRSKWQQMLEAVHSVHQERIVHKDLKPANFLSVMGELKLIDFGISRPMVDESTMAAPLNQNIGTPGYMSPESLQTPGPNVRVSRPSDVWSLGCILYQMAYGKTPYNEMPPQHRQLWLEGIPKVPYPPLRNPHLLDAIKQCLKTNPEDRITIPGLLCHPFLRPDLLPVPSPAPPLAVGGLNLNEQQLQSLLAMANNLDVQMLRQLAATSGSGLAAALQQNAAPRAVPPAPAPPRAPPPPPPPPPGSAASRVAARQTTGLGPKQTPGGRLAGRLSCPSR